MKKVKHSKLKKIKKIKPYTTLDKKKKKFDNIKIEEGKFHQYKIPI